MANNAPEHLQEKLDALPTKPGVYLMKDADGKILYVGKAVNLRARVRSYFHASAAHSPKIQRLVASIADLDFIVTASELEALILESNLIKRHKPTLQRPAQGRQALPLHQDHLAGGLSPRCSSCGAWSGTAPATLAPLPPPGPCSRRSRRCAASFPI